MTIDISASHESADPAGVDSARLRNELLAEFDSGVVSDGAEGMTTPPDQMLGLLAGLLIARWAGYDESERETIAAFNDEAFTSELPEALRRFACGRSTERHPRDFAAALGEMKARGGTGSAAARYVARIAPLVIHATGRSRRTYERLYECVGQIDFGTARGRTLAARLFDEALRTVMAREGKLAGEFVTPEEIGALMLELADPEPGHRVYDPCFGFGDLLVGAVRRLRVEAGAASPCEYTDTQDAGIFGVEIDPLPYAVGLCRTLLAGVDGRGLELTDALERPLPRNRSADGFDRILATPPWGRRTARPSSNRFRVPSRNVETLFLQHVMANLRPGGRAVVALPEELLSRPGSERQVRKVLASEYGIDAVVSLPAGAFSPWTGIAVSLVVFRRAVPRPMVRFISLSPTAWQASEEWGADMGGGDDGVFGVEPEAGYDEGDFDAEPMEPRYDDGDDEIDPMEPWYGITRIKLLRSVSDLIACQPDLPPDRFLPGVEAWDVPVRDLARRDHELVARKSGGDELDAEIERLVAAKPSLKIERLEHVAEVFAGRSYHARYTTGDRHASETMAGLIGAVDMEGPTPSRFLTGEGMTLVKEKEFLRPFDVVVSISGTVGNVTAYPGPITIKNMAGGATPGSGADHSIAGDMQPLPLVPTRNVAVLRARGDVKPLFLAALLQSPVYRNWLSGHARGTAVHHLTLRTLRGLRIPVPPAPTQEAVLEARPGGRGDAMAILARLLSGVANDPVAVWLETPLVAQMAAGGSGGTDPDKFGALITASKALESLVVKTVHRSDRRSSWTGDRRTTAWLGVAQQVVTALDGVASIPRGAGRLAVLEVVLSRLHEGLLVLEGADGRVADRLRAFTRAMVALAEGEVGVMHQLVRLEVGLEPAEVVAGTVSEVQLRLTNASPTPLRSLQVSTRPAAGAGQLPYLADGETHRVPLTVHPRDATRPLPIVMSWRARRLDGTDVHGEAEVALRVLSTREVVRPGDLGASPYIVGNPVDRHDMFFGRMDIMDRIRRQLGASTHANVILLEGNRRTGKTSILRQLGKAGVLPDWIPVYCSLQDAEGNDDRSGVTTRNVFKLLARTTGWALSDSGVETWCPGLPERDPGQPYKLAFLSALNQAFADEHAFETFGLYLSAAVGAASPRRVLLMLDEFDKLQEGIDAGITSPQVPENIRHLLQHQPGVSAIITGSRRLKRLREEYWSALFGLGHRIGVSALPIEDARRLVTEPVEGRLAYLPQARDRLVELCAGHPFLVQSLCNRVFEWAAATDASTVTVDAVQQTATEMVRDNEHFRTLWDYTGTARRGLVLALCDRLQSGPDAVNLDLLGVELGRNGVPVRRARELADDVMELRELELLDLDDSYRSGTYRLTVPLMAQWMRMNVDYDDLVVRAREEALEARR